MTDTSPGATPDSESGILEVFHAGAWGTLCDGDFGVLEVRCSPPAWSMPHTRGKTCSVMCRLICIHIHSPAGGIVTLWRCQSAWH